jgi:hypothetical protein
VIKTLTHSGFYVRVIDVFVAAFAGVYPYVLSRIVEVEVRRLGVGFVGIARATKPITSYDACNYQHNNSNLLHIITVMQM